MLSVTPNSETGTRFCVFRYKWAVPMQPASNVLCLDIRTEGVKLSRAVVCVFTVFDAAVVFVVNDIFRLWYFYLPLMIPGGSVSTVSHYRLDGRGSIADREFFLCPLRPDRLWGPPSLLYSGYRGLFPGGKAQLGRDADHSPPSGTEVNKV
jgi:hypothetical protein